jgi:ubiquinone/menaquinone biosynthesis C-methylase UbiE
MPLFKRLKQLFTSGQRQEDPAKAYDQWAEQYDHQPENLMLALDEELTTELLSGFHISDAVMADIGCGTGRHWGKLLEKKPATLMGFDVSTGMLDVLKKKYPEALTSLLQGNRVPDIENESCDLVFSTLTIAHIENIQEALAEWYRILKPGGDVIFTDYHPDALARGARRTFSREGKLIAIRNYIYPVEMLKAIAGQLQLEIIRFKERSIDESVRHFYERQNAIPLFDKFYRVPIIYGIHLKKADAVAQSERSG